MGREKEGEKRVGRGVEEALGREEKRREGVREEGGGERRGEERGKKLSSCPIGPPRGALRLLQGAAGVGKGN